MPARTRLSASTRRARPAKGNRPNVLDLGRSSKFICMPPESLWKTSVLVGAQGQCLVGRGANRPVLGRDGVERHGRRGHGGNGYRGRRGGWRSKGLMQRLADTATRGAPRAADAVRVRPARAEGSSDFSPGPVGGLARCCCYALALTRLEAEAGAAPAPRARRRKWQVAISPSWTCQSSE